MDTAIRATACATMTAQAGLSASGPEGFINPPIHRSSTVMFPDAQSYLAREDRLESGYFYGLYGTPATRALEAEITRLEGGVGSVALPSATSAVSLICTTLLSSGDEVLVPHTAYGATIEVIGGFEQFGVRMRTYDARAGGDIVSLLSPDTRLVWLESPGSFDFEVQDIPAMTAALSGRGIVTVCDGTWATPLRMRALALGCDISLQSATKYIGGNSEVSAGLLTCRDLRLHDRLRRSQMIHGLGVGALDAHAIILGLRSLHVRLERQAQTALDLGVWLTSRPEVARVLNPARPDHSGHEIFRRDLSGGSGLFAFTLCPSIDDIEPFARALKVFRIGAGWGGTISLVAFRPPGAGSASHGEGWLVRVQTGLEDALDLREDLARGLAALVPRGDGA